MTSKNIPKLRFKEFEDEWEINLQLGETIKKQFKGKAKLDQLNVGTVMYLDANALNGDIPFMSNAEHDTEANDVLIMWDGSNAGKVFTGFEGALGSTLKGYKIKDENNSSFIFYHLLKHQQKIYEQYRTPNIPHVIKNFTEAFKISSPAPPEQSAIGTLFQSLDELLSAYKDNLANYQAFKATMLSKMFPKAGQTTPEIRLDGFGGEWEVNTLNNLATFSKGNGYTKGDLSENGQPIILYGQLYTNYQTVISESATFVAKIKDNSVFSEGGEVIVPASGESSEDISRASVVDAKGILLGGDLNIIKVNQDTVDSVFLALTISNGSQQRELIKRAQGKSVVHLRNNDLEKVILTFPSIEEQRAIGAFFANLDDLIASQQAKITELETLKKKLLQDMFV